jgi:hypothetical protein
MLDLQPPRHTSTLRIAAIHRVGLTDCAASLNKLCCVALPADRGLRS